MADHSKHYGKLNFGLECLFSTHDTMMVSIFTVPSKILAQLSLCLFLNQTCWLKGWNVLMGQA